MPTEADAPEAGPLTVAFCSPGWPPSTVSNGIATYVENMRLGLSQLGHRPLIFSARVGVPDPPDDVVHIAYRKLNLIGRLARSMQYRVLGQSASIRCYAEALRVALLDQNERTPIHLLEIEETFGMARHLIGRVPFPVVVKMHGPACVHGTQFNDPSYTVSWRLSAERDAITNADGLSSPSQSLLALVRQAMQLPLQQARVIPNPTAIPDSSLVWSREQSEPGHIIFVGRYDRHKGGDLLLDAFASVHRQRPHARLTMIGPDPGIRDTHGSLRHLSDHLSTLWPDSAAVPVTYLGALPYDQLDAWRRRAAAIVVPSRYDNFPNTVLESAAIGAPIVASDAGGIPEIIRHNHSGRLFRTNDAPSLAQQLTWMLDHPDESTVLGRHARRACIEHYSITAAAGAAIDHYRSVIAQFRR